MWRHQSKTWPAFSPVDTIFWGWWPPPLPKALASRSPCGDSPWPHPHLQGQLEPRSEAGSWGHTVAASLGAGVHTGLLAASQNQTKHFWTFCGLVSSVMVIFPIDLDDKESTIMKTESGRQSVTGFLCRLKCKTMPNKDFSDWVITPYQKTSQESLITNVCSSNCI